MKGLRFRSGFIGIIIFLNTMITRNEMFKLSSQVKLMAVGGYNGEEFLRDVELIDPFNENPSNYCTKPPNFPDGRSDMVAQFFAGKPMVCGGWNGLQSLSDCYEYTFIEGVTNETGLWTLGNAQLVHARNDASSSVLYDGDQLWIGGGYGNGWSTSEILHVGGTFQESFALPEDMAEHCAATINSTHIFIAGNYLPNTQSHAYIVKITSRNTAEITPLPPMLRDRRGAACASTTIPPASNSNNLNKIDYETVRVQVNPGLRLFVAGGYDKNSRTSSEFYDFVTGEWKEGPTLPRGFAYGGYVTYTRKTVKNSNCQKGFILLGGYGTNDAIMNDIMHYDGNNEVFEILPGKLETARIAFGAILVEGYN